MKQVYRALAAMLALLAVTSAGAQEVRYSWFDFGLMAQDVSRSGTAFDPLGNQTYEFNTSDGSGVRFRGSVGTWNNFYALIDFGSSDPKVDGVVTNNTTGFTSTVTDEFDLTTIRGGIGYKFAIGIRTDVIVELTYDSIDLDFGNPVPSVPEFDFDMDAQDIGAAIGIRSMLSDKFEVRAHGRFSNVGDPILNDRTFDSDTLFGAGMGYEIVRGFSITADYESGEIESFSLGFRLDLDED